MRFFNLLDCLFASTQTPQHLCPHTMSSMKNACFQNNIWAENALGEFAISLFLIISFEPVSVETESMNFSALEAQYVYRWKQNNHPCYYILANVRRDIRYAVLIDG